MADEGDIILSELDDDELVLQMHDDLYDGLKEEIEDGVNILLERGWAPYDVLTKALVAGMTIVGADFRDGILFVPEVLLAANAMKAGMAILKPLLAETGAPKVGKMVIGTVKGDIHDIGKNLVGMMMEGAGFEVVDLGHQQPGRKYLEALEREEADILGMSALLTTTMPYMKVVIDTMKEKGMREDFIVLVGGAPLNEEFGRAIGADAYCRDAAVAVQTAKDFMARKHNVAGWLIRVTKRISGSPDAAAFRGFCFLRACRTGKMAKSPHLVIQEDPMTSLRVAMIVFTVILAAGATIWLAMQLAGSLMPGWVAAVGPILLACTLIVHLRTDKK
jgi:methylmalonyl-CoA mutase cobalamin-binding domain/chain